MKSMVAVILMLTVHERMRMVIVVPVAPLPQEGHMYHKIDRTSSIDCKEVQVRIVVYNSYNVTGIQRKKRRGGGNADARQNATVSTSGGDDVKIAFAPLPFGCLLSLNDTAIKGEGR
jgi:hypothetical protein